MRLKHHYQLLKKEFNEEIAQGVLREDSEIFIIREPRAIVEGYYYIHDWYYVHELPEEAYEESDKYRAIKTTVAKVLTELDKIIEIS